jgi:hypothetical protein
MIAILCLQWSAFAQAQNQKKGDASIRFEYQYADSDTFSDDVGDYDYWSTDSHTIILAGDYAISDRLTVYGVLPWVQKRFVSKVEWGGDPHNPNDYYWVDFVPPDKRFIDDGDYHGGFQDLAFGIRYLALDGPLSVSPYIGYGFPTTDYPFFGKAAIGKNLWNVPVGVSLMYVPYFSDWHFRGSLSYVFSEKPLGVNVDHLLGYLSAGYWFKQNFSMAVFMTGKWTLKGLRMPEDFTDDPTYGNYPDEFDTPEWWQHDRLIANRAAAMGIEFDYFVKQKYKLSGSVSTGIWAEQTSLTGLAFSVALSRYFGGE